MGTGGKVAELHNRRVVARRTGDQVGTDDLRALIQAEAEARKRDRDVQDRRLDKLEARLATLTSRVLLAAGAFAAMVYVLNWIGPTVVRRLIGTVAGTP